MSRATLLTGSPGCGKTTLIRRVLAAFPGPAVGFYTQEIREGSRRVGFEVVTLDGRRGVLAHVNIRGPHRVGKYGVDLNALDSLAVGAIWEALDQGALVVIDEIGPMEIKLARFRQAVLDALQSDALLLGTIARRSTPFTDQIKALPGVALIEVRRDNRETLLAPILARLGAPPA